MCRMVSVSELQRHPGNITFVAAILFLQTFTKIKWVRKVRDHSCICNNQKFLLLLLFTEQQRHELCMLRTRGLTWQQSLEWYFISLYWWFCVFSSVWHMGGHWRFKNFSWSFPMFEWGERLRVSVFTMALPQNAVLNIPCISSIDFLTVKHNLRRMHYS